MAKPNDKGRLLRAAALALLLSLLLSGCGGRAPAAPAAEPEAPPAATEAPKPAPTPEPTPEPTPAPTEEPAPYINPFTDVHEGDWYYAAVLWAGERGIVSGTEFQPDAPATRAQALTFLWRAAGSPEPRREAMPYADVAEGDWYCDPVLWGFESGLISESADGLFRPGDTLSRAQATVFLCRASGGASEQARRGFADVYPEDWYFGAASWALDHGVVGRDADWSFHPERDVTRAMFVTLMHRAFDESAQKAPGDAPAQAGFRELGIDADVDSHAPTTFRTVTKNGNDVSFTAVVTDYRVFDSDGDYPAAEGREWRVMTVETSTTDLDGSGLSLALTVSDYYNIALHCASKRTDGDAFRYTVWMDGALEEYSIRCAKLDDDFKGTSRWCFAASVPIGYDGVVVGMRNSTVKSNDRPLNEYYTTQDDFALFRMN